jgi:hypothetical protein
MARRQSINVRMRAIIVLPSAFSPGEMSEDLQVRGGAALRELARAMIPPKGYKQQLNFGPGSLYESVSYERPFDGVYFIDGTRGDGLIPGGTKYGVFPAAAGWIRQILDEGEGAGKPGSGSWFTTYLDTNRFAAAGLNTERMTEGVFGVFGIKSFYTPARTWKQTYRLQMAEHLVQYIADPVQGETPGTLRANPQPEGAPLPSERAHSILEQDIKYGSEQQVITSFLNTVSSIVRAGGESNPDSVSERAGAWKLTQDKQRRQAGWEGIFMELPQDPDFADLRGRIDLEQQDNFQARFKPSDQLGRSPGEESAPRPDRYHESLPARALRDPRRRPTARLGPVWASSHRSGRKADCHLPQCPALAPTFHPVGGRWPGKGPLGPRHAGVGGIEEYPEPVPQIPGGRRA